MNWQTPTMCTVAIDPEPGGPCPLCDATGYNPSCALCGGTDGVTDV